MMKHFKYLGMAAAALWLTACSDDVDNPYAHQSTLQVVSSEVDFTAAASTGKVMVSSQGGAITAKTASPWATATVEGNTVTVEVTNNSSLEGRSTLLTIYNAQDSVNVSVQQLGMVFRLETKKFTVGDAAGTVSSVVQAANLSPTISTSDDWLTAELKDGRVVVNYTENTTGHPRSGSVYYSVGDFRDSIPVFQCEFDKDIAGTYFLAGTDEGKTKAYNATLSRNGSKYTLTLPDLEFTVPVNYDVETATLTFAAGDSVGVFKMGVTTYHIVTSVGDAERLAFSGASMSAGFEYFQGRTVAFFVDNGSWTGTATSIMFAAYSKAPYNRDNLVGVLVNLDQPYLLKNDAPTATTTSAAPLRLKIR